MVEYKLMFANLKFHFYSEKKLDVDAALKPFLISDETNADIQVYYTWSAEHIYPPKTGFLGEDLLCSYYSMQNKRYCFVKDGSNGSSQSCTTYDDSLRYFQCVIRGEPNDEIYKNLSGYLIMLPIKEIFLHHGILYIHSSQIIYRGKGIVFAAPSGTGKTTQSKLWELFRNAEMVCNDRTLIRKVDGKWLTYGFPIDGSEPVRSSAVNELGCLVLLRQAQENRTESLSIAKAAAGLIPQIVMDAWDISQQTQARELIFSLLESCSIFQLYCTADERAVEELEQILIERRVLENGGYKR